MWYVCFRFQYVLILFGKAKRCALFLLVRAFNKSWLKKMSFLSIFLIFIYFLLYICNTKNMGSYIFNDYRRRLGTLFPLSKKKNCSYINKYCFSLLIKKSVNTSMWLLIANSYYMSTLLETLETKRYQGSCKQHACQMGGRMWFLGNFLSKIYTKLEVKWASIPKKLY